MSYEVTILLIHCEHHISAKTKRNLLVIESCGSLPQPAVKNEFSPSRCDRGKLTEVIASIIDYRRINRNSGSVSDKKSSSCWICCLSENTRASYPIEYIPNAKLPCVGTHPSNVILLACDAFGVLPPVSKLTLAQTMYHFISGYTALIAGTEEGIKEPQATFSACFGAAFIMLHPTKYADTLADKMKKHGATGWLVNTGWSGGSYGVGKRIKLAYTRKIIDAIHDGSLLKAQYTKTPVFGLHIPDKVNGVPSNILHPENMWSDQKEYNDTLEKLAGLFVKNFQNFTDCKIGNDSQLTNKILEAGPKLA